MKKATPFLLAGLILGLIACETMDVESAWAGPGIEIDGRTDDWRENLYDIKDTGLSLGVRNDDRYVYVCLRAADRRVAAQVLRAGLIVWFDPKGGSDKFLGIHYPLEADLDDLLARARGTGDTNPAVQRERRQALAERRSEIEILGPGRDESIRLNKEDLRGIEAAFANTGGMFVYEIKVPLSAGPDSPYAVGLESGNQIGIGFDSPRPDVLMNRQGEGMRVPGGGGMGGRMGGRGMRGGMGGGRIGVGRGGAEPLKMWLKVTLAGSPENRSGGNSRD